MSRATRRASEALVSESAQARFLRALSQNTHASPTTTPNPGASSPEPCTR